METITLDIMKGLSEQKFIVCVICFVIFWLTGGSNIIDKYLELNKCKAS
jgi:hypothetical protein